MDRRPTNILVLLLILAALGLAWAMGHTQDDAFITFRYSKNLVNGLGAVYNPGEQVEGYSNFLWMLVMAIPIALGLDPVTPSWLLGLLFLGLNLWLCYRLASRVLGAHGQGFVVFLLLVSHDALVGFGTSGMETAMNGFLWTAMLGLTLDFRPETGSPIRPLRLALLGGTAALCVLSRPDGLIIAGLCLLFALLQMKMSKALVTRHVLLIGSSFFLPLILWLAWKWSFYGDLLPNTFHSKGDGPWLRDGLQYTGLFAASYLLLVPAGLMLAYARRMLKTAPAGLWLLWALVVLWGMYLVWIGGDFMFFRMWVPVLPALYLLVGVLLFRVLRSKTLRHSLLGLLLVANLLHFVGYGRWYPAGFALPIQRWTQSSPKWLRYADQGKALHELFGGVVPPVRLAVGAAGALPYYSGLPVTDLYGLTDKEIARHGRQVNFAPGHRTLATFSQLAAKGAHLWTYRCDRVDRLPDLSQTMREDPLLQAMEPGKFFLGGKMRVVSIPVGERFVLQCPYLTSHPYIDAKIQSGDFQVDEIYF